MATTIRARLFGAVLAVALIALPGLLAAQTVRLRKESVKGGIDKSPINATIYKPEGAGPFPAIIVLHDCGGVNSKDQAWAKRLTTWGYVAVIVDSFGTRGTLSRSDSMSICPSLTNCSAQLSTKLQICTG